MVPGRIRHISSNNRYLNLKATKNTFHLRTPMDIVVGSLGGLKKLFDEGYLRKSRVVEVGIDEVDSMLDDTFRCRSQYCA